MSDPVTNADIEDVLSSIRRLVTEDKPPSAAPKPAAADRLVLTPALRVMDSETPEEIRSADAADVTEDVSSAVDGAPLSELPEPELLEGHELVDLDSNESAKRNLEARIAELEAVISDNGGQWEQDGEEGSDNAGGTVESLTWDDEASLEAEAASDPEPEIEEAQMAELVEEPEAEPIAPMPFLRHQFHTPEDKDVEAEVEEAELVTPEEESEVQDADALIEEPTMDAPEVDDFPVEEPFEEPYEGHDFVVDEEALRALVVEIVHQELQGKLGERITRNVRNLVRREVHRALTSQELE